MCSFLCDVKHLDPLVALDQLCSGPITVMVTDSCSGCCVLATRANRAIASKRCDEDEDEAQVNIIFARVVPGIQRRTVDVPTSEERGELLANTGDSWEKKDKKKCVCS